jgi:hypothetical protein
MPYSLEGNCVKRKDTGETMKCYDNHEDALKYFQALQANVKNSAVVEMSMRITKASYNKSDPNAMKWSAIDSDTDDDLYQEKMSVDLYKDFLYRIENKVPIPEPFAEMICESDWCGGMPYLSIAHYKAGTGKINVPGDVESIYIDGTRLKSKGILHNNSMGRAVWEKLREDMYIKEKSENTDHLPVRISIGFLDLEHKHLAQNGGQEFTFVRKNVGEICPLCAQGINGKIYTKGQLVHLAMTRVPVNPRTEMVAEKSMGDEITSKRKDAESIVGDLANELEEKSIASDVLVVRADDMPKPEDMDMCDKCLDPNTNLYDQECIDKVMMGYMPAMREQVGTAAKSEVVEKGETKSEGDCSHPASHYLVVEDSKKPSTWHLRVKNCQGKVDTRLLGAAKAALTSNYRGHSYAGPQKSKALAKLKSLYKSQGLDWESKSLMEESMAETTATVTSGDGQVDKGVLGIPEKPFNYAGLDGNGNNNIPAPVKAKKDEEGGEEDTQGDEMEKSFATLRTLVNKKASVEEINQAFGNLGTAVEKSYTEKSVAGGVDLNAIAEIVRSAVAPLQVQIAQLQARVGDTVSTGGVVKSKALNIGGQGLKPEDLIQRSVPQPQRKLTKIEEIAYRSTGALK